jgi:hypothetical protein
MRIEGKLPVICRKSHTALIPGRKDRSIVANCKYEFEAGRLFQSQVAII